LKIGGFRLLRSRCHVIIYNSNFPDHADNPNSTAIWRPYCFNVHEFPILSAYDSHIDIVSVTSLPHLSVSYQIKCAAPAPMGGGRGAYPLNRICPPPARGLARHNKRFTIVEVIKIVTTICQILRLKCTKSFVGWGSAPDPAVGAYSAPPDSLAGF